MGAQRPADGGKTPQEEKRMASTRATGIVLLSAALAAGPALGGVVYEIEVKDHDQSPPRSESTQAAVEGRNLKMSIAPGSSGGRGDMIFRGDRREMVVVDHEDKSFHVIDEETMQQIAGQVNQAMSQMQEALKNVPEEQRAMVEKMMKQRMPAQTQIPERPTSELRKTGERGDKAGYPCVKYDVLLDGRKIRELWVTDWDNIEGGRDVVGAFEEMADFFTELLESIPDFGQGVPSADSAFEHLKEIGGFPVVTREYDDDGSLENESTLRSAQRRSLDPTEFEPPAGYKRRSMLGQ
jgi:hypothetical protein